MTMTLHGGRLEHADAVAAAILAASRSDHRAIASLRNRLKLNA